MNSSLTRTLSVITVLFLASACALSEDIVDINYVSETSPQSIGAEGKTIRLSVDDLRGKYFGRIGAKINGYGEELAAIKSTTPVRDIVYQAFAEELKARNIQLSNSSDSGLLIEITALNNNFQSGAFSGSARGISAFDVAVRNVDGSLLYSRNVAEVFVIEDVAIASGENAAPAVEGALSKTIKTLFEDQEFINALVAA